MERDATNEQPLDETNAGAREDFRADVLEEILELERSGETGLFAGLVDDYLGNLPSLLERIDASYAASQWGELEREAHSLKSSSLLLGLEKTGDACFVVEEAARDGHADPTAIATVKARLLAGVEKLKAFKDKLNVSTESAGRAA